MNQHVKLACKPEVILIKLENILPTKQHAAGLRNTSKYKQIAAAVRQIAIIEPLIVFPNKGKQGTYILLDGHVRLNVLNDLDVKQARCLVALDDEAFTYNHKVNRLSAVQEHFMIRKAIANGVSEELISRTLNIDLSTIRKKRDLLDGICSEAVALLKDRRVPGGTFKELRKVRPIRQIEIAELMLASHNFSVVYAECLFAATPTEQLVDELKEKEVEGLSSEDMARMEREMENLGRDFSQIEETYGQNTLNLVIVVGYLKRMLDNARVVRFLSSNQPEILSEFQKLIESKSLGDSPVQ